VKTAGPQPSTADLEAGRDAATASLGRVHLIGIGGAGMSGIARILRARNTPVSGSDVKDSRALEALRAVGATVWVGHDASHVEGADTVVVSSAIRGDNPELLRARDLKLNVMHRAQALVCCMAGRTTIAIAGTHGKTTTTSMLTVALQHCGADPSFYIGGQLNDTGAHAHDGSGDLFVAEADESDGSFLLFEPSVAIVTNVEAEHLDHYGTPEAVHAAFDAFTGRLRPDGLLVACADDRGSARLAATAARNGIRVVTYGTAAEADVRIEGLDIMGPQPAFEVVVRGRRIGSVQLRVPGRHNALNATAALAAASGLGFAEPLICEGLGLFSGTRRRFELKGTEAGVRVFYDYAHHPTELAAVLEAARTVVGQGRLIVAFQPHRYTRTAAFREQLGAALAGADHVVVMEVYPAGEEPIPGASGSGVAAAVPLDPAKVSFEPSWSAVAAQLASNARPGDVVMTLGAGDVTMLGPEVLVALRQRADQAWRPV
jgi:UDP-N-acetylmuramate--alanine ligase